MMCKSWHVPLRTFFIGAGLLTAVQITASNLDERIEGSARQSSVFREYLQNDEVQITSRNGVVRLTGTVLDESHIILASETVASLPGVVRVINQLAEQGDDRAEYPDTWLVKNVHATLFFHRNVDAEKITMSVHDGVVMLGGMTGNATEEDLAATFTGDVREIEMMMINNMTVAGEGYAAQ